jgi:hypothetical protein
MSRGGLPGGVDLALLEQDVDEYAGGMPEPGDEAAAAAACPQQLQRGRALVLPPAAGLCRRPQGPVGGQGGVGAEAVAARGEDVVGSPSPPRRPIPPAGSPDRVASRRSVDRARPTAPDSASGVVARQALEDTLAACMWGCLRGVRHRWGKECGDV